MNILFRKEENTVERAKPVLIVILLIQNDYYDYKYEYSIGMMK